MHSTKTLFLQLQYKNLRESTVLSTDTFSLTLLVAGDM